MILRIYLPFETGVFPIESYTIADEVDFSSLIEIVKRVISNLPAIEVFFSTEFIYKKIGEDVNLFKTIDFGIQSIMTMLNELDKEISVEPSQARKTLLDEIDKLFFTKCRKKHGL